MDNVSIVILVTAEEEKKTELRMQRQASGRCGACKYNKVGASVKWMDIQRKKWFFSDL